MTASYAGASFETRTAQNGLVPRWSRQARISRRSVPYSDRDDLQSTGLGNPRVTLSAYVSSDAAMATLQAAQGITRRQLVNPFGDGTDFGNVCLVAVGAPRRRGWAEEHFVDLSFEQVN